jgi:DNA-binding IclR family transcriptional regulator
MVQGLTTVAAPVTGVSGTPIGYIVLIGLFSAETARVLGPSVAGAGRVLSQQLGARKE